MKKTLNVAVIGGGFMGRAHSNAWLQVGKFFDIPYDIKLKVICGSKTKLEAFAERWGYDEVCYDWRDVVTRDDIDIVDVVTPTKDHAEIVIAAAEAGKHVLCEKPCALTSDECKAMADAVEKAGVMSFLNHNYRRVPAVAYAKKMIEDGKLGTIYHWRGAYLQDWIMDPDFPLTWHLDKTKAGGGPLFDLGSHAVDVARFLIGEVKSVQTMNKTFIKERPLPGEGAATFSKGEHEGEALRGEVTVDDASFSVVEMENGALGSIEVTRFAPGRKNYNRFEVYGSKGALTFNFERMNELEFLDFTDSSTEAGYRVINVSDPQHPYIAAWWPPGHPIGYEHTFTNGFADFLQAMDRGEKVTPDFRDGEKIIRTLEAMQKSSDEGMRVDV